MAPAVAIDVESHQAQVRRYALEAARFAPPAVAGTFALVPPALIGTAIASAVLGALSYFVTYPLWLLGLGYQFFAVPVVPTPYEKRVRQLP